MADESNELIVNPQRKRPLRTKPKHEQAVTFTPLQRQVMELHAIDGLTGAAISKQLNRHKSQVSRILSLPKVQEWLLAGFKAPDVTRVEGDLRINIDLS